MDPSLSSVEAVTTDARHRSGAAEPALLSAWQDHAEEIYAFLVRTTRDPAVAEDLLQDAFVRLLQQARSGGMPDNPRAWLYRVAANLACSRGRRLAARVRWLARTGSAAGAPRTLDPLEAGVIEREHTHELLAALGSLEPDARAALLMRAEGFRGDEIAGMLGRSDAATRALMWRARVKMQRSLERAEAVR